MNEDNIFTFHKLKAKTITSQKFSIKRLTTSFGLEGTDCRIINAKSHQCDFIVHKKNDNVGYLINYHSDGVSVNHVSIPQYGEYEIYPNSILEIVTSHFFVSYGPLPTNAQSIVDSYFSEPIPPISFQSPDTLPPGSRISHSIQQPTNQQTIEEIEEASKRISFSMNEDGVVEENFLNSEKDKTKQNEGFGPINLGYFKNDTDDYSFSESYNVGSESHNEGELESKASGNVVTFSKGSKFYFGYNKKLFNAYEKVIKKLGGKAFKEYPYFLDGTLPTFENDGEWHLTEYEPQYENTFYVVDENDSRLIVSYLLCIFSQIPIITSKFLTNLKYTEAVRTKEIKTDDSDSSYGPYDFLAPVIPPELGDFPELKQPFAFKPDNADFKKQIRFQIPSAYGEDQDLYKKFIRLIGGRVVDRPISNTLHFDIRDGIDHTIYTFGNESDTNKQLFKRLSLGEEKIDDRLEDTNMGWEWVKLMIKNNVLFSLMNISFLTRVQSDVQPQHNLLLINFYNSPLIKHSNLNEYSYYL